MLQQRNLRERLWAELLWAGGLIALLRSKKRGAESA